MQEPTPYTTLQFCSEHLPPFHSSCPCRSLAGLCPFLTPTPWQRPSPSPANLSSPLAFTHQLTCSTCCIDSSIEDPRNSDPLTHLPTHLPAYDLYSTPTIAQQTAVHPPIHPLTVLRCFPLPQQTPSSCKDKFMQQTRLLRLPPVLRIDHVQWGFILQCIDVRGEDGGHEAQAAAGHRHRLQRLERERLPTPLPTAPACRLCCCWRWPSEAHHVECLQGGRAGGVVEQRATSVERRALVGQMGGQCHEWQKSWLAWTSCQGGIPSKSHDRKGTRQLLRHMQNPSWQVCECRRTHAMH